MHRSTALGDGTSRNPRVRGPAPATPAAEEGAGGPFREGCLFLRFPFLRRSLVRPSARRYFEEPLSVLANYPFQGREAIPADRGSGNNMLGPNRKCLLLGGLLIVQLFVITPSQIKMDRLTVESSSASIISPVRLLLSFGENAPMMDRAQGRNLVIGIKHPSPVRHFHPGESQVTGPNLPETSAFSKSPIGLNLPATSPGEFLTFTNRPVQPLPALYVDQVDEPSVANNGSTVFYTGNFYTARSTDGGTTWAFRKPWADMSDFCCDQDVVYNPSRSVFLWSRLGLPPLSGGNVLRLGISPDAKYWLFYNIHPFNLNPVWDGQWFDYPTLAFSNNYLYVAANTYAGTNPLTAAFQNSVIMRLGLDDLKNGTPLDYRYYSAAWPYFTFAPVQGALNVMYWGTHVYTSTIRLYSWDESSSQISFKDIGIPSFLGTDSGQASCPSPDGADICPRTDDRVLGGWVSNGIIGFLWDVRQGNGFPYPYIDVVRFDEQTLTYIDNPIIWNSAYAWIYGWASPNARGDLGLVAFVAGSTVYPSLEVGIKDDYSGAPPPWEFHTVGVSTNGPDKSCIDSTMNYPCWGDYVRVRPFSGNGYIWISSGYTLQGSSSLYYVVPQYVVFGRARDTPFDFSLTNSGDITVGQGTSGSTTITASLVAGLSQPTSLSCSAGLPPGTACYFSPASGSPTFSSVLTVSSQPSTPVGSYPITVTGMGGGQTHTTLILLTVTKALQVSIAANPTSGYVPLTVAFTSDVSGGTPPYTYAWAFGDGATDSIADPIHTYQSQGTYTATLTLADSRSANERASVSISATLPPLQAYLLANPTMGVAPLQVTFTNRVSGGLPPYSYTWAFGDGGSSSQANPSHTYQTSGNYTVTVVVVDSQGAEKSAGATVAVIAQLDVTIAANTTLGTLPLNISFSGNAYGGTPPYQYYWSFGDGGSSGQKSPTHTYHVRGTFTVDFTLTDSGDRTVSRTLQVRTLTALAVLILTDTAKGIVSTEMGFDDIVSGGLAPYSYAWSFGDGTARSSAKVNHTYRSAGTYTVTLVVTDSFGGRQSASAVVTIFAPLSAELSADVTRGNAPLAVQFQALPAGSEQPYSFDWDFGDGAYSVEPSPSHTYAFGGTYNVKLTVRDNGGHSVVRNATITVAAGVATSPATYGFLSTVPRSLLYLGNLTLLIAVVALATAYIRRRRRV